MSRIISIIIVILLFGMPLEGAETHYEVIGTDIAQMTENTCAFRDRYGFLWVGKTSGVDCYDGNGKLVFDGNTFSPLTGITVSSFLEDGENIWIGTEKGLYIYDRLHNRVNRFPYTTKHGVVISSYVPKVFDAGDGSIWIATLGQGIFVFHPETSTLKQNSRKGSFYTDIVTGVDGSVYAATINGEIHCFDREGELSRHYNIPGFYRSKNEVLLSASGNNIWIASGNRLYVLETEKGKIREIATPGLKGVVNTMVSRSNGSLLLSTEEGIWSYNTVRDTFVPVEQHRFGKDRVNNHIRSMLRDNDGNILLVKDVGAIDVLVTRPMAIQFAEFSRDVRSDGVSNTIRAITKAKKDGCLLVGTDKGIYLYTIADHDFTKLGEGTISNLPVSTINTNGDDIWIGTSHNGLFKYDFPKRAMTHYTYDPEKPYSIITNKINHIGVTPVGEVLFLTDWGVCRYDEANDCFLPLPEIEQNTHAISMINDPGGGIWISSSNNGLYYRQPGSNRFDRLPADRNPVDITLSSFALGEDGRVWAATTTGDIYYYDEGAGKFVAVDLHDNSDALTTFLCSDSNGRIWLGTDKSLIQVAADGNHRYYNFGRQADRLPVLSPGYTLDHGVVAIGGEDGILLIDPSRLQHSDETARVFPLALSLPFVENSENELERLGLNRPLYTLSDIRLPYADNTFTIRFAAARPIIESDVRYDYMLEGVDKGWILGSAVPEVTYNNLAPGDYQFLLRPHGTKSGKITRMAISVLPPWYSSTWAYIVYFILFALFVWTSFSVTRTLVRKNFRRKMNEVRVQKEREVFEAKTRYFVDLVHEIRTPLMLISLPLEHLAEDQKAAGRESLQTQSAGKYIKSMQQNIDYLLGITNQLLDFRRAENDSEVRLNISHCNVSNMLRQIVRRFEEPMKLHKKTMELVLPENDVIANIDTSKTERLVMNLIGNGMKYAESRLIVSLEDDGDDFRIIVADDGPGVPVEERQQIFDQYYQIGNDKVATTLGTGLGLAYAKLIADAHRGNILVRDNPGGHGAVFVLTLPKGEVSEAEKEGMLSEYKNEKPENIAENKDITVLLVEDNADLRDMVGNLLSKYYTVLTAVDGESALKIMEGNNVDIIVSDVMMEGMDGMELCRRIKTDINTSHIPFVMLTAMTTSEAHEEGLSSGADVYLEKPFPLKQLVLQIENLLRTRRLFHDRMSSGTMLTLSPFPQTGLNKLDAEFLEKMNRFIEESVANEQFSIESLASNMNMSRSSFYRKITSVTGMSPNEYLKNFRLIHAANLLRDGYRVSEVAERVGFTSSSYFAKCFRDKFGVLPSDWLQSLKK